MRNGQRWAKRIGNAIIVWVILCGAAMAQTSSAKQPAPAAQGTAAVERASIEETRGKLLALLRRDRKLSAFVARDAQLLADQGFIQRNNPELASFLTEHPEVTKNPEFYLFAEGGDRLSFNRDDWPDTRTSMSRDVAEFMGPFLVFICLLLGVLWLVRTLLESRRWSRMLNVQTEAQNKLLDKFGSSADLLAYLRSDVDKRLLPPIGVELTPSGNSISNPVARVLGPLQAGIILAIVGIGVFGLRSMGMPEGQDFFTAVGIIMIALGIGLIIAAAAGWFIARHFGLLPDGSTAPAHRGESAS